jgi:hypothetical protein
MEYEFPVGPSGLEDGFHIFGSIGGGEPIDFLVDTGSTGLLVSRDYLAQAGSQVILTGERFTLTYSSSGYTYKGYWAIAPVSFRAFTSPNVSVVTTVPMMIQVADEGPGGVRMLGVGFDPHNKVKPDSDINPFLMLPQMLSGEMTRGFIITISSIILGITPQNSAGFEFTQLSRNGDGVPSDWAAPLVTVLVPGVTPEINFQASLLMDTGLDYSIVQAPKDAVMPEKLANGQEVRIELGGKVFYQFAVGDAVAPKYVSWGHLVPAFINTGRFAMSEIDYLYDAGAGRLGFRPRNQPAE